MDTVFHFVEIYISFIAKDACRLLVEETWDGMEWRAQSSVAHWMLILKNLIG